MKKISCMNIGKSLVWTATILMLISFIAVRSPATVRAVDIDKTDPPSLGTLTIGNNILDAHIENTPGSNGIGTYTIETGSTHPNPGENVFYGGAAGSPWSSYNTIHVTDTMCDYVTTTSSPTPDPGYTLVDLDSLSPTVATPDPTTVMISWTTPENLQIVQVNEALGTTESDTRVRTTMRITNNDDTAHHVGVRYEWDLMINGWDGAWIRPWTDATTPGTWLNTETEWTSPTFQFWETSNIPVSLFSVYGGLSQPPDATTPDRLVYAHWSSSYSRAYSYTPTGMVIGSTTPTIGGQYDSAVLYYWNPTTINSGETKTTTAYVTTFLLEHEPPIEDLSEETISDYIQSADVDGDGTPDFAWNSGYDISFESQTLHIEINIQLVGDDPGDALRQQWHDGIEDIWSDSYDVVDGLYTYPIEVAVNWVDSNPHHVVTVHSGQGRPNMLNWYTDRPGGWGDEYQDEIAAHEAGHMLGLYDEYAGGALDPDTQFTTTNSLMADLGPTRDWHYEQILEWLETGSGRDLSLAQSPLPPYPLDSPIPDFSDPMGEPPVASFTESTHTAPLDTPITFHPGGSYDPDGTIILYEWDFDGDGTYDVSDPSPNVQVHKYSVPGTYTVHLRVTDNDGLTDTATDIKTITPTGVIPEVPLGTIMVSVAMIIALVAYVASPRWRRKPLQANEQPLLFF